MKYYSIFRKIKSPEGYFGSEITKPGPVISFLYSFFSHAIFVCMDEKFFDLKKDKQDRIINAALRCFALHGYKHASTDEIVAAAGVSKGLLFHYFGSKNGLYLFLCDYGSRYVQLSLRTEIKQPSTEYFELQEQLLRVENIITEKYPYMLLFLDSSVTERTPDAIEAVKAAGSGWRDAYGEIGSVTQPPIFMSREDASRLLQMIRYTKKSLLYSLLAQAMPEEASAEKTSEKKTSAKSKVSVSPVLPISDNSTPEDFRFFDSHEYNAEILRYFEMLRRMTV